MRAGFASQNGMHEDGALLTVLLLRFTLSVFRVIKQIAFRVSLSDEKKQLLQLGTLAEMD